MITPFLLLFRASTANYYCQFCRYPLKWVIFSRTDKYINGISEITG
ncbi:MAG: hypothetical protein ACXAEU_22555 [Candidatus Hodarchaeales archaeon]